MSMLKTKSCDYQYSYSELIRLKIKIMEIDSERPSIAELFKKAKSEGIDNPKEIYTHRNDYNSYDKKDDNKSYVYKELWEKYSRYIGGSEAENYFETQKLYTQELKKLGKIYKDTVKAGEFYKTHKVAIRHNDAYAMLENKFWDFLIKLCYDDYELALKVFFDATPYLAEENKE